MGTGSDTEQDWAPFSSTDLAITPAPYGDLHTVSPFVATPQAAIDLILKGLKLTAEDFLVDLGCGRGTINICAASQFKCRGLGVDIDGSLVEEARKEAEEKGVGERVEFREEDVATTDLTSATAITSFLVPRQLRILQPTLLKFLARGGKLACYHYRSAWLILFFQKYCKTLFEQCPNPHLGPPEITVKCLNVVQSIYFGNQISAAILSSLKKCIQADEAWSFRKTAGIFVQLLHSRLTGIQPRQTLGLGGQEKQIFLY